MRSDLLFGRIRLLSVIGKLLREAIVMGLTKRVLLMIKQWSNDNQWLNENEMVIKWWLSNNWMVIKQWFKWWFNR